MTRSAYMLGTLILLSPVQVLAAPQPMPASSAPAGPGKSASAATPAATPNISCPGDTVVWVNPRSKAYHLAGDKFFGHTKQGTFMCRKAADAAGDHPVKKGK